MLPKGFLLSTEEAGIKKGGRRDLALIYSETEAAMAGLFTTNKVKGAPVKLDIERVKSGKGRAVVINSGNANVCTGRKGLEDAREMARIPAEILEIDEGLVYVCSTGVIGTPMPMDRIRPKLKTLAQNIGGASLEEAARAIMTTDTVPKFITNDLFLKGKKIRISAFAKGAGMIQPNVATMLCFIMTDAAIGKALLKRVLSDCAMRSFNRITVDGETSTSDTVLLMANGMAGNPPLKENSLEFKKFKTALDSICFELSRMMVKDGEGATKLIEINIKGARSEKEALSGAFTVANSLLFKTAMYGNDSNWGRIMAALGRSGISLEEERVDISIKGLNIVKKGAGLGRDAEADRLLRENKEISITLNLNLGKSGARVLTCDLSEEYVRINAEYRT
jgi:glutamate N-acetyltransferase/amino-acid N-acetyltransferase